MALQGRRPAISMSTAGRTSGGTPTPCITWPKMSPTSPGGPSLRMLTSEKLARAWVQGWRNELLIYKGPCTDSQRELCHAIEHALPENQQLL
mmetsp:Transcript_3256/g.7812  ORF Transcript_3256/g.7812 Transcript_3256/m.7812 type:complete len:92 (+) Transcript_3256:773-1048(+)